MLDDRDLKARLARGKNLQPGPDCVSDDEIASLIGARGGPLPASLEHIARCDWCGERLRLLSELEVEPDHAAPRLWVVQRPPATLWWLAAAALVAGVAIAAAWMYYGNVPRRANALLAEAYSARRTFDWRLPDHGWTRRDLRLSPETDRPAPLLQAEALLSGEAHRDAILLDLAARADLLEIRTEAAIAKLSEALALAPNSADVLCDLGVAYALRADRDSRPEEFAHALDFNTRALALAPRDARVLFNRGLLLERLHMVDQAIETWRSFLSAETDTAWKAEARDRLAALEKLKMERVELMGRPDGSDAALERAAVEWLVKDRARARAAGEALRREYGDTWLADAVHEATESTPLAQAVEDALQNRSEAVIAAAERRPYRNFPAHEARLQLEFAFALTRQKEGAACLKQSEGLIRSLKGRSYSWIRVQAMLHRATCLNITGNVGAGAAAQQAALEEARKYHLQGLEIRAAGLIASSRILEGNPLPAWGENRDDLARVVRSPYSVNRIQQCAGNYAQAAHICGWNAAAVVFMQAAASALHANGNLLAEATNHALAASYAMQAGLPALARSEAQAASRLLTPMPASTTRTRYMQSMRLFEAEGLLYEGKAQKAFALLAAPSAEWTHRELSESERIAGLALLRLGRPEDALVRLRAAVREVEAQAASERPGPKRDAVRRKAVEAYRALAALEVERGETANALHTWLLVHGSETAPTIAFLALAEGYAVWCGSEFRRIRVDRAAITAQAARLNGSAADATRSEEEVLAYSYALYQALFAPLPEHCRQLPSPSILPDAELASLPFGLILGRDKAPTLSAGALEVAWKQPENALVVLNPASQAAPEPVPDAAREADAIRMLAPGARIVEGRAATLESIGRQLPEAGLFHFAGHGYSTGDGALYLADLPLTGAAIESLTLRGRPLVVLSACGTASGETLGMTNGQSLVRAFLGAGASAVVASRWRVDSAATSELMRRFYAALPATRSVPVALARASNALRAEARYHHPYYWAGFQVYQ